MSKFWKKIYIIIAVFVLIYIIIIALFLIPSINNLKNNKVSLSQKQNELNENYSKITSFQKIAKNPEEFNLIIQTPHNYWPDESNISDFIVQTEGLANEVELIINNFSIEDSSNSGKKPEKKNESTEFSISAKTGYSNIFNLIKNMEELARLNSISSISLSATDEDISLKMTGQIYHGK